MIEDIITGVFAYFSRPENISMGIIIILLLLFIWRAYLTIIKSFEKKDARIDSQAAEIKELYKALATLQEKRGDDLAEVIEKTTKALADGTNAQTASAKSLDGLAQVIQLRRGDV